MAGTLTRKRRRARHLPRVPRTARDGGQRSEGKVADMTIDDLQAMIEATVDRALAEWIGDPDAGLELRPEIVESIERQRKEYAAGKRGKPLDEVAKQLRID